jgi:hypothetical protein
MLSSFDAAARLRAPQRSSTLISMAKKRVPKALKAYQFGKKKGASPKKSGAKGGRKSKRT